MRLRNAWVGCLGIALAASVTACGGGQETSNTSATPSSPAAAPSGQKVDTATAGTVTGTVAFEGTAPKNEAIKMNADPVCVKQNSTPQTQETYMVGSDGKSLANVFVYVKEGLGNRTFDVPKEAITLDQSGCRYHPHVLGVVANQTIKIVNSDPTTHNIHPTPKDNREWNESQPPQAAPLEKTFAREEIMLPVKCNQHPWMRMFVNVTKSPFFAVTGPDGKYEIKGLPPGDYTIAFVQEKLGEQDVKVTLAAKDTKTVDATFKP